MKKATTFITKPAPGPHSRDYSVSLNFAIKYLGHANTSKEVKHILNTTTVLVDGRRIKNPKFPVGFLDVITFESIKKSYRMVLDAKGKIDIKQITKNTNQKIVKIRDITMLKKGKRQLNLLDGRNLITDDTTLKTGDSLVLELPSQKIVKHLPMADKAQIWLIGGKHSGDMGAVHGIEGTALTYENKDKKQIQTLKKYAYVITSDLL
jgi:small subunit ribosomal protein S4e